ncbi:hypothetical protein BJ166DRAFT_617336 [Pestalotiopsis sp. NC0098]|nr:hypothetical protein BJ166DRAFT_617336 [Pestalotiopsis sp. NC0098]
MGATRESWPESSGRTESMLLDLSDLSSIRPAVDKFLAREQRLHVLFHNAGVMNTPVDSKSAQIIPPEPLLQSSSSNYMQSKAVLVFLAHEYARELGGQGITSVFLVTASWSLENRTAKAYARSRTCHHGVVFEDPKAGALTEKLHSAYKSTRIYLAFDLACILG